MGVSLVSPFPEYALPQAFEWLRVSLRFVADDFAMKDLRSFVDLAAGIDARGGKTWGIRVNESLLGWISFEPVNKVSGIVHGFMSRRGLGRKNTDEALKLALAEIFHEGYERVSFPVLARNHLVRGLLRRVGAKEEGLLRSFTSCGGELADLVIIGMVKADFDVNTDRARQSAGRTEQHSGSEHNNDQRVGVEQRFDQRVEYPDVQSLPDRPASVDGVSTPERSSQRSEYHANGNVWDELDQQHVPGDRGSAAAKPLVKRIRKQRSQRKRGAAN